MNGFNILVPSIFAEGFGLALVSPRVLEALAPPGTKNFLTLFRSTDLGDRVCAEGAVVPITGLSLADYEVAIRSTPPSIVARVRRRSDGWVIQVDRGPVLLCGLGYLLDWDARDPRHHRIDLPSGWYSVGVAGGLSESGSWAVDFLLEEHAGKPNLVADPSKPFDLYLDDEVLPAESSS